MKKAGQHAINDLPEKPPNEFWVAEYVKHVIRLAAPKEKQTTSSSEGVMWDRLPVPQRPLAGAAQVNDPLAGGCRGASWKIASSSPSMTGSAGQGAKMRSDGMRELLAGQAFTDHVSVAS